jgi:sec-independent protein translocase protein TatC
MAEPAELPPAEGDSSDERRMPFLEHLQELRTCLRNSAIAIFASTIVCYAFRTWILALIARPMMAAWAESEAEVGLGKPEMVFTSPVEPFMVLLKLAIFGGLFLASPFIFRELWRFISPGLYPKERRWGIAFIVISVVLFCGGAGFAYLYVLPASYKYFLGFSMGSLGEIKSVFGHAVDVRLSVPFAVRPMLTLDAYLDLTTVLLLVFGVVFELPLVLSILAMLGIVSAQSLWKWNRYAIIIFAVLGAVLTPGDLVVGQLAMTASLTVLYNLSILLAVIVGRKRKDAEEEAEAAT